MKIGNLDLGKKLLLAPMAEVSYSPFRKIAREYGAGITFTQMVSAQGVLKNNLETLRLLVFNKIEKPIGVQILGNDPEIIKEAVQEIKIYKPDLIDLNCGCSVSKVTKNNMGSRILDDPNLLARLVKNMSDAKGNVPVSVKLRLGSSRKKINVVENAKIAEDNGADLIIVHARTRDDSYEVDPDWSWIKKVKENVKIPVVGNGSVFYPQDAVNMIEQTGADSVMVARGVLGNPFIFSRFNSIIENKIDPGHPDIDEVIKVINKHIQFSIEEFGEANTISKSIKHIIWYLRFFKGVNSLIKNLNDIKDLTKLYSIINSHYHKIKNNEFENEDLQIIQKNFNNRVNFWIDNSIN